VLTTIEAALAGGVVLGCCDTTYRDMASMHGSYRKVAETIPALELIGRALEELGVAEAVWLLDRPVSNSGRLKSMIEGVAQSHHWPWRVELVQNPDPLLCKPGRLSAPEGVCGAEQVGTATPSGPSPDDGSAAETERLGQQIVVATADSAILDQCPRWLNLARLIVGRSLPEVPVVDLAGEADWWREEA